jgi:hypothetical protein
MTVAEEVRGFVDRHPYIQEAMMQDIVNYSALARMIEDEVSGGFEAVKVALRRYADELHASRQRRFDRVREVLADTSVELRSNVSVCKTEDAGGAPVLARTKNGYTLICEGGGGCPGEEIEDQVLITLESPEDLEDTPGVLHLLLSLLAGRGINVTELISCREDTHLVVDAESATEAFELLDSRLRD